MILAKEHLSKDVFLMKLKAPEIAIERQAGQFVIVQIDSDYSERIPLTIADADTAEGSITIIFQVVGKSTLNLSSLDVGESVENVLGPLGQPTHIEKLGHVVCVGGGIGLAPLYPIAKAMKEAGNRVTSIVGARTKDLLIIEEKMDSVSDELIICTDDGSYGRKALVTEPLKEVCEAGGIDLVVAIGPAIMMKFCAETTRPYGVKTFASLNTIMVDGTGMCGGCRVTVGNETKFVCVDGPEFDAHLVDFDNMMLRQRSFKAEEQEANHKCHLEQAIAEMER